MQCSHCGVKLGGLFGALRSRAVRCVAPTCEAIYCVECLPELAESYERGMGPLRRGVMEIRCLECEAVIHRTEFRSELEQSARDALAEGRKRLQEFVLDKGLDALERIQRKN